MGQELELLQQKAKVYWLKSSDTNSPYCHDKIKERRIQGRINSIHNNEGALLTDDAAVEAEFLRYFTDLLDNNSSCPTRVSL